MKRTGRILSLALILLMIVGMSFTMGFADGEAPSDDTMTSDSFSLLDTYPKDGAKGTSMENLGVKLYFDSVMSREVLGNVNDSKVSLKDPDGHKLPVKVLYSPSEAGVVLVLVDTQNLSKEEAIQGNTDYTLTISGDMIDNEGNTLGSDKTITFTTINMKRNSMVNMVLMFVMMGGMMVFSMKSMKPEDPEEEKKKAKAANATVNPYKEAKKTGKSVEEIVEMDRAEKAKQAEKEAKKAAKEAVYDDVYDDDWMEEGHYKAGKPRTVASAGSKYITGRKAIYEEKLRKEAERKALEEKWAKNAKKKGKKK